MRSHRWLIGILIIVGLVAGILFFKNRTPQNMQASGPQGRPYRVGIFEVVRHPVFDAMVKMFETTLRGRLTRPVEFVVMVPDGDASKIEQMAQKFATENYDLVYVIGTNLALSLAHKTTRLPIVLGAATDPVAAGLAESWEHPGKNVTGTSDLSPVDSQFDRLTQILPHASRIGIIYNPSEDNSSIIVERFTKECARHNLKPIMATISNANEIRQTLVSLTGKIDALYAPTDATLQSGFPMLINTANDLNIAVFSVEEGTVKQGAIFAVGFDYTSLGRISGTMSADILNDGAKPSDMPIRMADKVQLFYNPHQIKKLGLKVPVAWDKEGIAVP